MTGEHPWRRSARTAVCVVLAGLAVPCWGQSRGRSSWSGDVNPVRDAVHLYFDALRIPISDEQAARMNASMDPIDPTALAVEAIREGRSEGLYALNLPVLVGEAMEWKVGSEQPVLVAEPGKGESTAPGVDLREVGLTLRFRSRWIDPERRDQLQAQWSIHSRQYLGRVAVSGDEERVASSFGSVSHEFDHRITLGSTVYAATLVTNPAPVGHVIVAYRFRLNREPAGDVGPGEGRDADPAAASTPAEAPARDEGAGRPRGRRGRP